MGSVKSEGPRNQGLAVPHQRSCAPTDRVPRSELSVGARGASLAAMTDPLDYPQPPAGTGSRWLLRSFDNVCYFPRCTVNGGCTDSTWRCLHPPVDLPERLGYLMSWLD